MYNDFYFLDLDECKMHEMKIFNEELLVNEYDVFWIYHNYELDLFCGFWIAFLISSVSATIIIMQLANHCSSYILLLCSFITLFLSFLLFRFLLTKVYIYANNRLDASISSNPTLEKLKNVVKKRDRVNLVNLWEHFNPNHSSNSIILGQEQNDIELLKKLDDDLVHFIENADDITIKLFNLDDFESYKQLYMKYIAPKQKEEILNKIQTLTENLLNQSEQLENQESHLVNQLQLLKNEIDTYDVKTADYFEFKKWHKDILDMLKLDKDNDMVKNNYQNIIQEINSSQKED